MSWMTPLNRRRFPVVQQALASNQAVGQTPSSKPAGQTTPHDEAGQTFLSAKVLPTLLSAGRHLIIITLLATTLITTTGCESVAFLRRDAEAAVDEGDWVRAERRVNQVLEKDPSDWRALYYRGLIRLRQNRALDAQIALERAWQLRPNHEETPDILDALAQAYHKQGDEAQLFAFLERMTQQRGGPRDYLRQAEHLAKAGDYDNATIAYTKAAHFWPKNEVTPYIKMADFYKSINDKENEAIALRRAYGINPNLPRINTRLRDLGVIPGPTAALPPIQ